jgi:hypothetical protein
MSASEKPVDFSFMLQQLLVLSETVHAKPSRNKQGVGGHTKAVQQHFDELCFSALSARRARGETYGAIAADLNRRGIRGRNGARWYGASVWTLLHRPSH